MLITKFLCIIIFINSCGADEYEPEENYDSEENHESDENYGNKESHESDENYENEENQESDEISERHPHRTYYVVLCTVRPGAITMVSVSIVQPSINLEILYLSCTYKNLKMPRYTLLKNFAIYRFSCTIMQFYHSFAHFWL